MKSLEARRIKYLLDPGFFGVLSRPNGGTPSAKLLPGTPTSLLQSEHLLSHAGVPVVVDVETSD